MRLSWSAACAGLIMAVLAPQVCADEIDRRVDALMHRMTLAEKLGQISLSSIAKDYDYGPLERGTVGNVMNFGTPEKFQVVLDHWRKSRLRIPLLHGIDIIYGFRTLFAVPIAQAATFDLGLNAAVAEMAGRESSSAGSNWTFAPMVDLSRDSRWGRVVEGAGEDVHLAACLAGARVRGFRKGGLVVAPKHFVAYGFGQGGRDYDAVEMGEPFLRDHVLPPFRAAIAAGAETVMSAFNAFNGVPATANPHLLKKILRHDMHFEGVVVSDWGAIDQLRNHGLSADPLALTVRSFGAGVDMEMASTFFATNLPTALARGLIDMKAVDVAVRRVLRLKFAAKLETRMVADQALSDATLARLAPSARALAVEVGRRSMVLLENRNDRLPLAGVGRIALVGGLADSPRDHMGPHPALSRIDDIVTLRKAITERAATEGVAVDWFAACGACRGAVDPQDPAFQAAVRGAEAADVVVAVVGESHEESGEGASRSDLALSPGQTALVHALAKTGKPVVLLVTGGRPVLLEAVMGEFDAALMVWFPGTYGAIAAADILFGDAAPSARLPMTWPRSTGQLPMSYDRLPTGRPASVDDKWTNKYIDVDPSPRYPFGYGLSTSRTLFSGPRLDRSRARADQTVTVTVHVANAGSRAVRETVQVYVHQMVASRSRPVRQLKGFASVDLAPGEARDVAVPIRVLDLGFHDDDGNYVVEPGIFRVFAGRDSDAADFTDLAVTTAARLPPWQAPIPCLDTPARAARR